MQGKHPICYTISLDPNFAFDGKEDYQIKSIPNMNFYQVSPGILSICHLSRKTDSQEGPVKLY